MSDDGHSFLHIHALRHDGQFYPVAEKGLKLEFIGDSITSGEGLFGARQEEDWIPMFFSALKDYAFLTAKGLDAEYRVFSQSGWGVHCSWDNNIDRALPRYYREICSLIPGAENERLGGNGPYDPDSWQPDYVIVNLGTNDASAFGQPAWLDGATGERHQMHRTPDGPYDREDIRVFQDAVTGFLRTLRECDPGAHIIWCYGMLGNTLQQPICEAIASYREQTGDGRVSYLQLPEMDDASVGSRDHPGPLCHQQAAAALVRHIRRLDMDSQVR